MDFNNILYNKSNNISEDFDFNKVKHRNTDIDAMDSYIKLKVAIDCLQNKYNMKCVPSTDRDNMYYIYSLLGVNDEIGKIDKYNGILYTDGSDLVFEYISTMAQVFKYAEADMRLGFAILSDEIPIDRFILRVTKDHNWYSSYIELYALDYNMLLKLIEILEILPDNNCSTVNPEILLSVYSDSEISDDSNTVPDNYLDIVKQLDKKFPNIKLLFAPMPISKSYRKNVYRAFFSNKKYFPYGIFNNPEDCRSYLESKGYSIPSEYYIKSFAKDFLNKHLPHKKENGRSYQNIMGFISEIILTPRINLYTLCNVHTIMKAINTNDTSSITNTALEDSIGIDSLPIKVKYAYIGYINYLIWK